MKTDEYLDGVTVIGTYHIDIEGVWSRSDSSLPTDSHKIVVVGEGNAVARTTAVACQWSRKTEPDSQTGYFIHILFLHQLN